MRRAGAAGLAGVLVTGLAVGVPAAAADPQGHEEGPPTVTGADLKFTHPSRTLSNGAAADVGLVQEYVDRIVPAAAPLAAPLAAPADGGELRFRLWYDTEPSFDRGQLLVSTDNGTSWGPTPVDLRTANHRWTADPTFSGFAGRQWLTARVLFNGERPADAARFAADGWAVSSN